MGRLGPDLADDVRLLIAGEPLDLLFRDVGGKAPPPAHGQEMPRDTFSRTLVRGWAGGMSRGRGHEPIAEAVEPAVVVGLQHDRVPADDHLAFDNGDVPSGEPGLAATLGRSSR